jgi:hypothetical protein
MRDILQRLRSQAEDEGFEAGTPKYEFRLLELRVERCRELQEVTLCSECKAFESCNFGKDYARRKVFTPPSERP